MQTFNYRGEYINIKSFFNIWDYFDLFIQFFKDPKHELFGEDVTYGYFTLPFIYAINNFPKEGNIILSILILI